MSSNLTVTDLFAGAGGSSTGAASIPGVAIRVASNHWAKAVAVHNANHPDADHVCADISQIDPRLFPTTDLLWASPECTNHSVAKGKKRESAQPDLFGQTLPAEAAERSRATMWDVPRFTEAHRYQAVIVENVVDARHWPPFRAWLMAMDSYGYNHQIVYLNSMHAQFGGLPAPQSRDRMYVVFWRKGNPEPDLHRMQRPKAWCPTCDELVDAVQAWKDRSKQAGRYRAQYVYRCPRISCRNRIVEPAWLPASSAIDWSILGKRIGDRERPLAEKTLKRIATGIDRYWRSPEFPPLMTPAGGTWNESARPATEAMRARTTRENEGWTFAPIMTPVEGRDGKEPRPATAPMRTQTTRNETGIAFSPFIAELRGGGSDARPTSHPMSTVTASGNHHGNADYQANGGVVDASVWPKASGKIQLIGAGGKNRRKVHTYVDAIEGEEAPVERHPQAKRRVLTSQQRAIVARRYADGESANTLAAEFDVSTKAVSNAVVANGGRMRTLLEAAALRGPRKRSAA